MDREDAIVMFAWPKIKEAKINEILSLMDSNKISRKKCTNLLANIDKYELKDKKVQEDIYNSF